jgi:hypothetical protein
METSWKGHGRFIGDLFEYSKFAMCSDVQSVSKCSNEDRTFTNPN